MKKFLLLSIVGLAFVLFASYSQAAVYTENFNAPFPAWESGWFGANSNAQNYYVTIGNSNTYRGNNPDGLWISDGNLSTSDAIIVFNHSFGAQLTGLSIDIAGFVPINLRVFDILGNTIFDQSVALTGGAFTLPGVYSNYSVTSTDGISGFTLAGFGSMVEGNTSIDNIVATTSAVPVPPSLLLLAPGLLGLVGMRRRFKK